MYSKVTYSEYLVQMKIKRKSATFFIISLIASLVVGFRGNTNDTQDYYDVFRGISKLPIGNPIQFYLDTGMEIGFGWYAYVIHAFTSSSVVLFSIFSFMSFYLIYKTAKILEINYLYPAFLYLTSAYFFILQFMQIRQGLAVCLAIFSVVYAIKNGFKLLQLLLIGVAISLHQSAAFLLIFCIPFFSARSFFLVSHKFEKITGWAYLLALVFFFKFVLLNMLINFSSRLKSYADSGTYNEAIYLLSLPNIRTFLILVALIYFSSKVLNKNIYFRFFLFMMYTALAVRIGFSEFAIMSGRLSTAFSYVEIFAVSMLLMDRLKPIPRIISLLVVCVSQLVVTLKFQAPYLFELYFEPIYKY